MTAHAVRHFDLLAYVEKSLALGVDEKVAKHQARQMEEILEIASNNTLLAIEAKELATKGDLLTTENVLRLEIEKTKSELKQDILKSKIDLILWVAGMFIASGLIQHFFK